MIFQYSCPFLPTGPQDDEEEKTSNAKKAIARIRARLISQDRMSKDSYGSIPQSDEDYGESFDRDDVDDNFLVREDNQSEKCDEIEVEKPDEIKSSDVEVNIDSPESITGDNETKLTENTSEHEEGGVDNAAFENKE